MANENNGNATSAGEPRRRSGARLSGVLRAVEVNTDASLDDFIARANTATDPGGWQAAEEQARTEDQQRQAAEMAARDLEIRLLAEAARGRQELEERMRAMSAQLADAEARAARGSQAPNDNLISELRSQLAKAETRNRELERSAAIPVPIDPSDSVAQAVERALAAKLAGASQSVPVFAGSAVAPARNTPWTLLLVGFFGVMAIAILSWKVFFATPSLSAPTASPVRPTVTPIDTPAAAAGVSAPPQAVVPKEAAAISAENPPSQPATAPSQPATAAPSQPEEIVLPPVAVREPTRSVPKRSAERKKKASVPKIADPFATESPSNKADKPSGKKPALADPF